MPRQKKSARLVWREPKNRAPYWEIRDGSTYLSTGTQDQRKAEEALAQYIQRKAKPDSPLLPQSMGIGQCLNLYGEGHAQHVAAPQRIGYAIDALYAFWGDQPVSIITGETCRRYARQRTTKFGEPASAGTVRRELNVLQAALNYCHAEGYLTVAPKVTMPPRPAPKERWLTRQEAAFLLRGARSLRVDGRHLADFILHGLYTGSRKATILSMRIDTPSLKGGHVNTETGVFYRKPIGKVETKKRQGAARLPDRYLAYLRIQARNGRRYVVEDYQGRPIGDIKNAWKGAIQAAQDLAILKGISLDLTGVTPHTLKHTAITWALQKGATTWDAAGYFSTSIATIEQVYGHHSPDHQKTAVDALNRRF